MRLARRMSGVLLLLAISAGPVHARVGSPVVLNQWYTFCFGAAGTFATSLGTCSLGANSVDPGSPPWLFVAGAPFKFILTDGFNSGDNFTLFDNAVVVGSLPAGVPGGDCGNDEPACLASLAHSHAIFDLGPGSYSFTIMVSNSPFGGGAAFFRLEAGLQDVESTIPEPGSILLVASGLLGLAAVQIRRRRRNASQR